MRSEQEGKDAVQVWLKGSTTTLTKAQEIWSHEMTSTFTYVATVLRSSLI